MNDESDEFAVWADALSEPGVRGAEAMRRIVDWQRVLTSRGVLVSSVIPAHPTPEVAAAAMEQLLQFVGTGVTDWNSRAACLAIRTLAPYARASERNLKLQGRIGRAQREMGRSPDRGNLKLAIQLLRGSIDDEYALMETI
jgi:hypothetical protein